MVCLASGPSLNAEDCAYVHGKAKVIAVNDGIRFSKDFADVLYSSDVRFWRYYKGMPDFHGLKYAIEQGRGAKRRGFEKWPDIAVLRNTGDPGLEQSPEGLKTGRNSGAAAINLAVHLGASRILLLGYDMNTGPNGQAHFFGQHPPGLQTHAPYQVFRRMFEAMVAPLRALGIEVINCTERSSLECFPKRQLREVLRASAEVAA